MRRLARFIKEWQTVFIGLVAGVTLIATFASMPGRVSTLEAKDIEQDKADTELEKAQATLSTTLTSALELHKEQKKQNAIDHRRYEEVQKQLTELHLQRVVNGSSR
ncbi:hypothetical protein LCGC14_2161210 [marine sediment metagenome]|uniref:Uncharacterized protein n=1 Tax=marine sediment metagenome TaxID=412755 RepID=A0A0F9GNW6_9ZZZZ